MFALQAFTASWKLSDLQRSLGRLSSYQMAPHAAALDPGRTIADAAGAEVKGTPTPNMKVVSSRGRNPFCTRLALNAMGLRSFPSTPEAMRT